MRAARANTEEQNLPGHRNICKHEVWAELWQPPLRLHPATHQEPFSIGQASALDLLSPSFSLSHTSDYENGGHHDLRFYSCLDLKDILLFGLITAPLTFKIPAFMNINLQSSLEIFSLPQGTSIS